MCLTKEINLIESFHIYNNHPIKIPKSSKIIMKKQDVTVFLNRQGYDSISLILIINNLQETKLSINLVKID